MSASSTAAFATVMGSIGLDQDRILAIFKAKFPAGATQQEVFEALVEGRELSKTELGSLFQQVSRILSTADKDGFLDGTETVKNGRSTRTLYRVPANRLPGRKTKMEIMREELEDLRAKLKSQNSRNDFLVLNNRLLREQVESLGAKPV